MARSRYLDEFVEQEIFVNAGLQVFHKRKQPLPLFHAARTALAQNDQAKMHFCIEKLDEIPGVGCDHTRVVLEWVAPDLVVWAAGKAIVRDGLRANVLLT